MNGRIAGKECVRDRKGVESKGGLPGQGKLTLKA